MVSARARGSHLTSLAQTAPTPPQERSPLAVINADNVPKSPASVKLQPFPPNTPDEEELLPPPPPTEPAPTPLVEVR